MGHEPRIIAPAAPYATSARTLVAELGSDRERGLASTTAAQRLAACGPNALTEQPGKSPWRILLEQFTAIMVLVLLAAAAISLLLGDLVDALAILAIVILNASLGFHQDYRAERAIAALRRLAVPHVKVRRDGEVHTVSAETAVPGDIVLLEAGDVVPADARLLISPNVHAQEAALTGESAPVEKDAAAVLTADAPIAERRTMVFMGTAITSGRAEAVIVSTGMNTELGKIAGSLQHVPRQPTPLQIRLEGLARWLAIAALALVGVVFAFGLWRGEDPRTMFLTAVSLAVAAVPEGLPAVVTISLALGAQRMLRRHALVRKLLAVESLGSVTTICSDKTGTLTENRMTAMAAWAAGAQVDLRSGNTPVAPFIDLLLSAAALCTDAHVQGDQAVGDPTETALVLAAESIGRRKSVLEHALPRVAEAPFDSLRKRMTTVHSVESAADLVPTWTTRVGPFVGITKGAVDGLLDICTWVITTEGVVALTDERRAQIQTANAALAQQAMRVLAVAYRSLDTPRATERDLTLVGLIGLLDPPRPEVQAAVRTCVQAGVRPVMITGDHPLTAAAIAHGLGISTERVVSGHQLAALDDDQLRALVSTVSVYARVEPEHKLRIVQALQQRGELVAMTGDGVNDAPALKRANIGIAMGVVGTDVAREAADMVLLDDNFATIVAAVEEGRIIYDNIRKFLKYLLTTNAGEIWLMLVAPLLGMPLPLQPLQILWINLVTDGLPALALTLEGAEQDVMRRPPRRADQALVDRPMAVHVGWVGVLMAAVALGVGWGAWRAEHPAWQTLVFTSLALLQMGHVLAIRVERASVVGPRFWTNRPLLAAVGTVIALQALVIYAPPLQSVFGTTALGPIELGWCVLLSSSLFWAVEGEKLVRRWRTSA